ncbi:MAG: ribosome small subunit-dependent GTPase A [Verrucomicrobia bacterium]|nr:ribosome small subunit-dependent GTPase A [Verrucomicrobiota bacterium]
MSKEEERWRYEEEYLSKDRKEGRKERKAAVQRDRSKYKKSDQDQRKKQADNPDAYEHLSRGRVLAIVPEGILVGSEGEEYLCGLKGALKQDRSQFKNLVAVGDFVRFEKRGLEGSIAKVEERSTILARADNLSRNKQQLIAVNIDQVLITASVCLPALKIPLIDRYIIAAEQGGMQPVIVINKIDLLAEAPEEKALFDEFVSTYQGLGYLVVPVSVKSGQGIEALKATMHGKTSVFSGQSGVGKSSLINLMTGSELATGGIVHRTRKGSHTTTTTHLIPLAFGGFCIDTPGIKSFGLWDIAPEELSAYFPEIFERGMECKFPDCSHLGEPGCAVQKAVEEGAISPLRFASYSALMTSLAEEHKHR